MQERRRKVSFFQAGIPDELVSVLWHSPISQNKFYRDISKMLYYPSENVCRARPDAGLMYFFGSGFRSDGLNVIVGNFAAAHALDGNQLLALATPASWAATPALMPSWRCWTSSPSSSSRWWTTPASARTEYSLFR